MSGAPKKSVHVPVVEVNLSLQLRSFPPKYRITVDGERRTLTLAQIWTLLGELGVQEDPKYAHLRPAKSKLVLTESTNSDALS
jgi:hypothetical protein